MTPEQARGINEYMNYEEQWKLDEIKPQRTEREILKDLQHACNTRNDADVIKYGKEFDEVKFGGGEIE